MNGRIHSDSLVQQPPDVENEIWAIDTCAKSPVRPTLRKRDRFRIFFNEHWQNLKCAFDSKATVRVFEFIFIVSFILSVFVIPAFFSSDDVVNDLPFLDVILFVVSIVALIVAKALDS